MIPSLIVGLVAAGMVLAVRFMVSRELGHTALVTALIVAQEFLGAKPGALSKLPKPFGSDPAPARSLSARLLALAAIQDPRVRRVSFLQMYPSTLGSSPWSIFFQPTAAAQR